VAAEQRNVTWIWRYLVATFKAGSFHIEKVSVHSPDEDVRRDFVEALLRHPAVVHDTDHELSMAQLCDRRWPCAHTAEILDIAGTMAPFERRSGGR
jgi:hypothetical protein